MILQSETPPGEKNFQTSCRTLSNPNEIERQALAICNRNESLIPFRESKKLSEENLDKNTEEIFQSFYPNLDAPVQGDSFQFPRPRKASGTKQEGEFLAEYNKSKVNSTENVEGISHSNLDPPNQDDNFQFSHLFPEEKSNIFQEEKCHEEPSRLEKDTTNFYKKCL